MLMPAGPTWVGIGSQRSGTTWFTRLLTSHPMVTLGRGGRKEQHWFNRYAIQRWTTDDARSYAALFGPGNGGEFTPAYMRLPWVAELLAESCPRPPLVIALVRDPLERFASSVRWQMARHGGWSDVSPLRRSTLATQWLEQATLGSMYGPQLAAWRDVFGPERMLVVQYEHLRSHPEEVVRGCWQRLGLGPVTLRELHASSRTATHHDAWQPDASLATTVVDHVRGAVDQAVREWNLDPTLWPRWQAALDDTDGSRHVTAEVGARAGAGT